MNREVLHLRLMLVLTFSTGIVDAVGFLGLDRVFAGNMTGNVVVLGMAIVGAEGLPVLGPGLALAGFLVGAAIGGRVLRGTGTAWEPRTTILFGAVAVVVFASAAVHFIDTSHLVAITSTTLMALGMGLQAVTARHVAVKDVTTVVVTSTLTGLAADSVFGNGSGGATARRLAAVVSLLVGAALGAALLHWHISAGIFLAAAVVAIVTVVGALHPSSRPSVPVSPADGIVA